MTLTKDEYAAFAEAHYAKSVACGHGDEDVLEAAAAAEHGYLSACGAPVDRQMIKWTSLRHEVETLRRRRLNPALAG